MITDEQALFFYRHPSAKRFVMETNQYFWDNKKTRFDNLAFWIKHIAKTGNDEKKFIKILTAKHVLETDSREIDLDEYATNSKITYPEDIEYIEDHNLIWEVKNYGSYTDKSNHCCLIYRSPMGLKHTFLNRYAPSKVIYTELVGILEGNREKVKYLKETKNICGRLYREVYKDDIFIKL
jgi:hypothetical protein